MELKTKDTYKASQFHKKSRIFMDTIVENFGFFVEGCHVPPVNIQTITYKKVAIIFEIRFYLIQFKSISSVSSSRPLTR